MTNETIHCPLPWVRRAALGWVIHLMGRLPFPDASSLSANGLGQQAGDVRPRRRAHEKNLGKAEKACFARRCPPDLLGRTLEDLPMRYQIAPLFCRPWTLNGITPRLI